MTDRIYRYQDAADLLRRRMDEMKLTLGQLAAQSSISDATFRKILSGDETNRFWRVKLIEAAEAVGLPPETFIEMLPVRDGEKRPRPPVDDDETARIQIDGALTALGAGLASLQGRADRADARADEVDALIAQLVQRIEDLETQPPRRGTKPAQ